MHKLEQGLDFRMAESKSETLISKSESGKTGLSSSSPDLSTTSLCSCAAVDKICTDRARRMVPLQ